MATRQHNRYFRFTKKSIFILGLGIMLCQETSHAQQQKAEIGSPIKQSSGTTSKNMVKAKDKNNPSIPSRTNHQTTAPSALKIGDALPKGIVLEGLRDTQDKQAAYGKPKAFSDRLALDEQYQNYPLVLISFWSTSCVPCIREIALLDSLKRKHPTAFNVLLISSEPKEKVDPFIQRQGLGNTPLHFFAANKQLDNYFPHRFLPHTVWIDQQGKVSAITGSEALKIENLLNFDSAKGQNLRTKVDDLNFNPAKPLEPAPEQLLYRTTVSKKIAAGNGGVVGDMVPTGVSRFFAWNSSLEMIAYNAYSLFSDFPAKKRSNLIEVHTQDSLRIFYPGRYLPHLLKGSKYPDLYAWEQENAYCYEMKIPQRIPLATFQKYLFADLERVFQIRCSIQPRKIPCHVVSLQKGYAPVPSTRKDDIPSMRWNKGIFECRNTTLRDIFSWAFGRYMPEVLPDPFVLEDLSEQQKQQRFDLDLKFANPNRTPSLTEFFQVLESHGIKVEKQVKDYPILVVEDLQTKR